METPAHLPSDPEDWVDRHGNALFRFALLRLDRRDLAEELVQETFLAAWKGRDRFAGRASERTWLTQILRNKIADHYRRRNREVPASDVTGDDPADDLFDHRGHWLRPPPEWAPDPTALLVRTEFREVLRDCLASLPERQAAAFVLRVMDERSTGETCNILGVTATNLGVLLHRARLRLRTCLDANWFGRGGRESRE